MEMAIPARTPSQPPPKGLPGAKSPDASSHAYSRLANVDHDPCRSASNLGDSNRQRYRQRSANKVLAVMVNITGEQDGSHCDHNDS